MSHARIEYAEFTKAAPDVVSALRALTKTAIDAGLEKDLVELVKIRASQINGCAFCLQYHLNEARKTSVAPEKLDLLATWEEAGIYSERERAALAWTEALTRVADGGVSDAAYAGVGKTFSGKEVIYLTAAIGNINAWNRIGVAFRFAPPIPKQN
jgi:AhpD family alkylhydroperoxidase